MTQYTVIYRTGGTARCFWHKTDAVGTWDAAVQRRDEIQRMGYKALIHKTAQLEAIGMPEGWTA